MVRLLLVTDLSAVMFLTSFTFQYGQIITGFVKLLPPILDVFTFQYGQIITNMLDLQDLLGSPFTFQYGQIITI